MSRNPSLVRLVRIVRALGPLADRVVFIGGAVAPLLHAVPVMSLARQTKDVDGVVASIGYAAFGALGAQLRERGFRHVAAEGAHAHRWRSPDGELLDLIPVGRHLGGAADTLDEEALRAPDTAQRDGVSFQHVTAPIFLAMKFAAFNDRGADDWFGSHDIEDVVALLASRPSLCAEVAIASPRVRAALTVMARSLLANDALDDVLAAHLNNAFDPAEATRLARARLTEIAALD